MEIWCEPFENLGEIGQEPEWQEGYINQKYDLAKRARVIRNTIAPAYLNRIRHSQTKDDIINLTKKFVKYYDKVMETAIANKDGKAIYILIQVRNDFINTIYSFSRRKNEEKTTFIS